MKPIREDGDARPNNPEPIATVRPFEEYVICCASLIWWVFLIGNRRIDHENLALVVTVKIMVNILHHGERETIGIESEHLEC